MTYDMSLELNIGKKKKITGKWDYYDVTDKIILNYQALHLPIPASQ